MAGPMKYFFTKCFMPSTSGDEGTSSGVGRRKDILWYLDYGQCTGGACSMCVVQGNLNLEDQSQVESGPFGTFVGIYDGHGGPDAARYVCDNLFQRFRAKLNEGQGVVNNAMIEQAFSETENGFIARVAQLWETAPNLATLGSCCLVGILWQRRLFVANLGDSRAVLGKTIRAFGSVSPVQLSTEHNANHQEIRDQLNTSHPDDNDIVYMNNGSWRVKGILQVSRAIGDAYMKHPQFNNERIPERFRLANTAHMPFMTAVPTIVAHDLEPSDAFVIFASDGLWEHLSNERAVQIVHGKSPKGSAKRLVKAALKVAVQRHGKSYKELKTMDKSQRRNIHDDISVVVLFLNHDLNPNAAESASAFSVKCALNHAPDF